MRPRYCGTRLTLAAVATMDVRDMLTPTNGDLSPDMRHSTVSAALFVPVAHTVPHGQFALGRT